jgi:hypothetical protein
VVTCTLIASIATVVCWRCTFLMIKIGYFSLKLGILIRYWFCTNYWISGIIFGWTTLITSPFFVPKINGSGVTTLTLGSQPKHGAWKGVGQECNLGVTFTLLECKRVWGNESTHSQVDSHFGNWNPYGVLNFQKISLGVKIHWIEDFIIPLESLWDVNV